MFPLGELRHKLVRQLQGLADNERNTIRVHPGGGGRDDSQSRGQPIRGDEVDLGVEEDRVDRAAHDGGVGHRFARPYEELVVWRLAADQRHPAHLADIVGPASVVGAPCRVGEPLAVARRDLVRVGKGQGGQSVSDRHHREILGDGVVVGPLVAELVHQLGDPVLVSESFQQDRSGQVRFVAEVAPVGGAVSIDEPDGTGQGELAGLQADLDHHVLEVLYLGVVNVLSV